MNKNTVWQLGLLLLQTLTSNGHDAYIVGGAPRDWLLKEASADLDIVTSATMGELEGIFPGAAIIRTNIPLLSMMKANVRVEISELHGRSLAENLAARDFTVNAIAINARGDWIDPFYGKIDIEHRVLRLVREDSIQSDPLRMLRAARLMADCQFAVDPGVAKSSKAERQRLNSIAAERIGEELNRLLRSRDAALGMQWLGEQGILSILCPEATRLHKRPVFSALNNVDTLAEKWVVFFYLLGEKNVDHRLKKWRLPKTMAKKAERLFFYTEKRMEAIWDRRRLYEAGETVALAAEKTAHVLSDSVPGGEINVRSFLAELPIQSRHDLAVSPLEISAHMNCEPGPWLGDMLHALELAVVDRQVANERKALLTWAKECFCET
ncbi:hypothetical protein HUG15_11045 [Salicibibacter cibarius]|uniref:CCA tRNA nucleotidyltransferase n=1 Tax=Salicibibacter cibarius TaxID=2743000 RepID=A0A7T7CBM8_9BACI|nr:hypothetical protein [Salicibibacter cibarius]QQK76038.1 hypothetical protein HUG15_11045 [Salicibibacter cibarius]